MAEPEKDAAAKTADATGDATEPARQDTDPPPLATKAADLDALRASVVDAASVGGGLWISYLGILFYLLIAIGSVTHKDLFLESPIKLPFMNVDLPMKGFFLIGPGLFLIAHTYVLLHFVMLADKIVAYDHVLVTRIADPDVRTELRRQLPANIFVQFLAGPSSVRDGITGLFLWMIALITMVIGPILLLLFFELQFLPYHHEAITWWQRFAVGIDLALLWLFWPFIALRKSEAVLLEQTRFRRARAVQRIGTVVVMLILTLGSPPLLLLLATFPGESLENALDHALVAHWRAIPGRVWLIEGEIDETVRRPTSLFSNRLILPGFDVIDHARFDSEAKIAALKETISVRGRHLEGAVLNSADLRKADFTGVQLQGADLEKADLKGARFDCALRIETDSDERVLIVGSDGKRTRIASDGTRAAVAADGEETEIPGDGKHHTPQMDANCPRLQNARLNFAQLQNIRLDYVQLQGARLDSAQMQGASLTGAQLQGASLAGAQLQGASLSGAQLQVANLTGTQLQGASLDSAQLQSALLRSTELQGASLNGTQLQGAWLESTRLQGASLDRAQFQGATLWLAQLQGASLNGTSLQGSDITEIQVWRASDKQLGAAKFRVVGIYTGPERYFERYADFEALKQRIGTTVPEGSMREAALKRIDPMLNPDRLDRANDQTIMDAWSKREQAEQATPDEITLERVKAWRAVGCNANGAPFVITGLIHGLHSELFGHDPSGVQGQAAVAQLAADFLAEGCAGAHGISAETRTSLMEMAKQPRQAAAH